MIAKEIIEALDKAKMAINTLNRSNSGSWIPCEICTPETHYSYTDDIDVIDGVRNDNYESEFVIMTVFHEGEYSVKTGRYLKTVPVKGYGKGREYSERFVWADENYNEYTESEVIAWMPFPLPYLKEVQQQPQ